MRVIAGAYRGRRLAAPSGIGTRPILDRVKVALFDWLGSRLARPGQVPPVSVLDVFCGGGSLGIECLSRGAIFCAFVESDGPALAALRTNIQAFDIGARAHIMAGPAQSAVIAPPPDGRYGLVFLDPPYRLNGDLRPEGVMGRVIGRLGEDIPIEPDAPMVWRYERTSPPPPSLSGGWNVEESRAWGTVGVSLFTRS